MTASAQPSGHETKPRLFDREFRLPLPSGADRWALLGLGAYALFFFRSAVFGGQALFLRDIHMVWYPLVAAFVRSVGAGSWPVWDPYRGFGNPLLADPSAQLLYPLTWLNLVLPPHVYYTGFVVLHVVLSSWGVYALARRWELSRPSCFVAAAVWAGSGPFLSSADLFHHFAGAAWIPWVFLAAERALERSTDRSALLWGAAVAGQILASSADMVALTGLALGLYLALHHVRWRSGADPANRALVRSAAIALGFAVGVSACLWLPAVDLARHSARWGGFSQRDRTMWSLHPLGLAEVFLPFHWSQLPAVSEDVRDTFDLQAPFLHSLYLGIPAAGLVAAGFASSFARRRFLLLAGLGALLVALGRHSFVYDVLAFLLPPLRILRFPVKAMLLACFCWSLLAGAGLDAWQDPARREGRWRLRVVLPVGVLTAACLLGALFGLYGAEPWGPYVVHRAPHDPPYRELFFPIGMSLLVALSFAAATLACAIGSRRGGPAARRYGSAVAALAVLSLMLFHAGIHPLVPSEFFDVRPQALEILRKDNAHPRVYVYDYTDEARKRGEGLLNKTAPAIVRSPVGSTPEQAIALAYETYLQPPTAGRWGLFGSYDLDLLGLQPDFLADLVEYLRYVENTPLHLRLLRMGSVDYVLALLPEKWQQDLTPVATLPSLFDQPIRVFKVPNTLPRSFVVGGVRVASGPAAIKAVSATDFDPAHEVILPIGDPRPADPSFAGASRVVELLPDRVRIEVEATQAGYAVLTDAYDPGWKATVDGRSAPVLRANIAFRAVPVPPGRHLVELVYRPTAVSAGVATAAATLLIGLGVAARARP